MFLKKRTMTRKRAVFLIAALGIVLASLVLMLGAAERNGLAGKRGLVSDTDGCVDYLASLGWETDPDSAECRQVVIPREFDSVFAQYARLQRDQGFDLDAYRGLDVQLYSLRVTNYPSYDGPGEVWATVLVRKGHVIGGDIHSTALDGFMHGLS